VNRVSARKQTAKSWIAFGAVLCGLGLSSMEGQDRYVEVRNGNIFVHFGASSQYTTMVRDLAEIGFNQVMIGTPDHRSEGIEVIQSEAPGGGFTLAESTALDMLISADRNPDRYAGLNPLAIKAILLAGARMGSVASSPGGRMDQMDSESGAGLISRSRSLEIFASGRQVAGSSTDHPMGWDRSVVYSGHPNRYRFEISDSGPRDLAAVVVSNPAVVLSGDRLVESDGSPELVLSLRRLSEDGSPAEVVATSHGGESVEYLYLGTLPAGRYLLEVASSGDGVYYGIAWHAQRQDTTLSDGGYDPVFLFRKGSGSSPVDVGSRIHFSGTAFGALDQVIKVEFFAGGIKIGESDRPEFDFSWIADKGGLSGVYAVATDRYGNQVFSSVATVEVRPPAVPPAQVSGPLIPEDLSGVYFGTISGDDSAGWIAFSVLPSGRASVLGFLSGPGIGFFDREGIVESDGRFVFPAIHYFGPNPSEVSGPNPGNVLSGSIMDQVVTGTFDGNGSLVSARNSGRDGNLDSVAGFLELGVLNRGEGRVFLVINGDGETRGLIGYDGAIQEIRTAIKTPGAVAMTLGNGLSLLLDLDDATGRINGVLSHAGGMSEELLGVCDRAERRERIANISTRGMVGNGSGVLIAGFVVEGVSSKQVLIRAIGPSLREFGIRGVAVDPRLVVRKSSRVFSSDIAINDDWDGSSSVFEDTARKVGAFPLSAGETDAAIILTLEPGVYTAQMSDSGSGGVGLIEVYDAEDRTASSGNRIINISTRGIVRGGAYSLVGGFVVEGTVPKLILVRAVGPSLAKLGVAGWLEDPRLSLDLQEGGESVPILENDDWGENANPALIRKSSQRVGAFPLDEEGKDAAVLILLKPGAYTVNVEAPGEDYGVALLEIYEVGED